MTHLPWARMGKFWRVPLAVAFVTFILAFGFGKRTKSFLAKDDQTIALLVLCVILLALHALWWRLRRYSRLKRLGLDEESAHHCLWANWLSVGPTWLALGAMTLLLGARLGAWALPVSGPQRVADLIATLGLERVVWLAGLGLVPAIWLGRYVEYGPHCAACGYCVEGTDRYQCAECGKPLGEAERIEPGRRARSPFVTLVAVAAALVTIATAPLAPKLPWTSWFAGRAPLEVSLGALAASAPEDQGDVWLGIERNFPLSAADAASAVDRLLTMLERADPPALHWAPLNWLASQIALPASPAGSLDRALSVIARAVVSPAADGLLRGAVRAPLTTVQAAKIDALMTTRLGDSHQRIDLASPWLSSRLAADLLAPEHVDAIAGLAASGSVSEVQRSWIGAILGKASREASTPRAWADLLRIAHADLSRLGVTASARWEAIQVIVRAARAGALEQSDLHRAMETGVGPWMLSGLLKTELPARSREYVVNVVIDELSARPARAYTDLRFAWIWLGEQRDAGALSESQRQAADAMVRTVLQETPSAPARPR